MIVSIRGRNEPDDHLGATSPFVARQIVKWDNRILENGRGRLLARGCPFGYCNQSRKGEGWIWGDLVAKSF